MEIKPIGRKLQIEIDQPTAGGLDLSSKPTTIECGTVVALGEEVKGFEIGDRIFFKAWQMDLITYKDQTHYFIDSTGEGICAKIKE